MASESVDEDANAIVYWFRDNPPMTSVLRLKDTKRSDVWGESKVPGMAVDGFYDGTYQPCIIVTVDKNRSYADIQKTELGLGTANLSKWHKRGEEMHQKFLQRQQRKKDKVSGDHQKNVSGAKKTVTKEVSMPPALLEKRMSSKTIYNQPIPEVTIGDQTKAPSISKPENQSGPKYDSVNRKNARPEKRTETSSKRTQVKHSNDSEKEKCPPRKVQNRQVGTAKSGNGRQSANEKQQAQLKIHKNEPQIHKQRKRLANPENSFKDAMLSTSDDDESYRGNRTNDEDDDTVDEQEDDTATESEDDEETRSVRITKVVKNVQRNDWIESEKKVFVTMEQHEELMQSTSKMRDTLAHVQSTVTSLTAKFSKLQRTSKQNDDPLFKSMCAFTVTESSKMIKVGMQGLFTRDELLSSCVTKSGGDREGKPYLSEDKMQQLRELVWRVCDHASRPKMSESEIRCAVKSNSDTIKRQARAEERKEDESEKAASPAHESASAPTPSGIREKEPGSGKRAYSRFANEDESSNDSYASFRRMAPFCPKKTRTTNFANGPRRIDRSLTWVSLAE